MEERFFVVFIHCYFIALGIMIGGTIIGSIGSFLVGEAPLSAMSRIVHSLKIWAIVAAIGGTFDTIEHIRLGFLEGSTIDLLKQMMFIIAAMLGVKTAILFIAWAVNEEIK